jgi:NADH-quinone oxidoreductase subunit L
MVAAGLFLFIKYSTLLEQTSDMQGFMTYTGFITGFLTAFQGVCLADHKSALASSTCDQIGLMILTCGIGNTNLALFQFSVHAFYKSLLFLAVGALIHKFGEQESRFLVITQDQAPIAVGGYQVGGLSLASFPGSISHFSKSLILNAIFLGNYGFTSFI